MLVPIPSGRVTKAAVHAQIDGNPNQSAQESSLIFHVANVAPCTGNANDDVPIYKCD